MYVLTTHQLQVERRESHRANQVDALTTHQLQVERRERHRDNQVDGNYEEAMIDKGQWKEIWPGHRGYTPTLFREVPWEVQSTLERLNHCMFYCKRLTRLSTAGKC